MKSQKIETYLPIFSGFYNTIYEFQEDNIIYCINQDRKDKGLSQINFDSLKIDYKSYELDTVKRLCDIIGKELENFVYSIDFQELLNPKEYNYKNDSVNVAILPKIDTIKAFIYANKEAFSNYLKDKYTSYDGFMSHYSNDFETWETDTKKFSDFSIDGHRLGSILEFIAIKSDIREYDIFESLRDTIQEENYIENYDILENNPSCTKCENVIEDQNILDTINKFKALQGVNPKTCLCENCFEAVYS